MHSIFPFSKDQVRVLIFRECDWTGRRILFDSSAVHEVSTTPEEQTSWKNNGAQNSEPSTVTGQTDRTNCDASKNFIDICNGIGYVYASTAAESRTMGEMIFGSVAMSFKGSSLKVNGTKNLLNFLNVFNQNSPIRSFAGTLAPGSEANSLLAGLSISRFVDAYNQTACIQWHQLVQPQCKLRCS